MLCMLLILKIQEEESLRIKGLIKDTHNSIYPKESIGLLFLTRVTACWKCDITGLIEQDLKFSK